MPDKDTLLKVYRSEYEHLQSELEDTTEVEEELKLAARNRYRLEGRLEQLITLAEREGITESDLKG